MKRNPGFLFALIVSVLVSSIAAVHAEVKLHHLFSDGMVLQQGVEVPVWGTANEGETVSVEFLDQKVTARAKDGKWMVHLKKLNAGGPFTLKVSGENTITVTNVLVGEVWLASGQSNMAFTLNRARNADTAVAAATDSLLRFFVVPHESADEPRTDVSTTWKACTPDTAATFSAVAYFFGRDLRRARNVPIGIIEASVGGTPAEAWTSRATLESDPELKEILTKYAESIKTYDEQKTKRKPANSKSKTETDPRRTAKRACGLYNAMIAALQPYSIAGAIWYQGEANSARAAQYQTLFPAMIRNWREAFGHGDFPFLFVQLAPHERMSPEIREAQLLTWERVPHTGMAVITDFGDAKDIHPKDKEPVGGRLALAARAIAYGEKIEYSGPIYKSMKVEGDKAVIAFDHTGSGLVAKGDRLIGFTIAGGDGRFVDADARIDGPNVVVTSSAVKTPTAVRYGWAAVPQVNLFNREGLPASPFRTDAK